MAVLEKISLERVACPEDAGVSSKAVAAFIGDLQLSGIETHSIMILRHGKVAFECWCEPYGPDIPHNMFSVSKSFTSTAVGFAVHEGLLSLDAKVLDFFPEYRPARKDSNLEKLTVFHLLTLTAGKDVSFLADKTKNRWMEDFFKARWAFAPGESWRYVSENTYMLSAILRKATGMSMTDYLMPRLFEPLGFGRKPFWETDGNGIETGGWGLFLTTEELAKFTLCWQQGGVFNGKQVIPADWAREAGKKQVENRQYKEPAASCGYGYGFWCSPTPGNFRADGMMSQSGKIFKDFDACVITTACEINEGKARDCIWRHFPAAFMEEGPQPAVNPVPKEKPRLGPLPELPEAPRSALEKTVSGKTIHLRKKYLLNLIGYPVSVSTLPLLYMAVDKAGNIDEVTFDFRENECLMSWKEGKNRNTVLCGMDGKIRKSQIRLSLFDLTASATAAWENEHSLNVWVRMLESTGQRRLKFTFNGSRVTVCPSSFPGSKGILTFFTGEIQSFIKNPLLVMLLKIILLNLGPVLEPKHRGRME